LRFISRRNGNRKAGSYQNPLSRFDDDIFRYRGMDIHPGGMFGHIPG
jgi:hypothetical protein